jgi:hypothetical protein
MYAFRILRTKSEDGIKVQSGYEWKNDGGGGGGWLWIVRFLLSALNIMVVLSKS